MIRLSLLPTGHPLTFQRSWVRSSSPFYRAFNLPMGRSLRFRVYRARLIRAMNARFRYGSAPEGLNLAAHDNSPVHYAKGTPSPVSPDESGDIGLRPLVGTWFLVLFTPLDGVLFTFRSPYWFPIGRWRVLSLGRWASLLHTEFHEHRATLGHRTEGLPPVAYGAITLCRGPFQVLRLGRPLSSPRIRAHNPGPKAGLG